MSLKVTDGMASGANGGAYLEFYQAVLDSDIKKLKKVVNQHNIDLNARFLETSRRNHLDLCPIHLATWRGYKEVLEFLLKRRCDVNATSKTLGRTAVHFSVLMRRTECLRLLIKAGAILDQGDTFGNRPCHYAAEEGECEILNMLIRQKVDVNAQDITLKTPLMKAARNGRIHAIRRLLDASCKVNMQDQNGDMAVHFAARSGHNAVVGCLIREGCNVNSKNKYNQTPLLLAVRNMYKDVAMRLIECGCDLDARETPTGMTALHICIKKRYFNVVSALLSAGCKHDRLDNQGESPAYSAVVSGDLEMIVFLIGRNFNFDTVGKLLDSGEQKSIVDVAMQNRNSPAARLIAYLTCSFNAQRCLTLPSAPRDLQTSDGASCDADFYYSNYGFWLSEMSWCEFPTLKRLCRKVLRRKLGTRPETQLERLHLPQTIKAFLNLDELFPCSPASACTSTSC